MNHHVKRLGYGPLFLLFAFATAAQAQQPSPARMQQAMEQLNQRFAAADTNKDGCLTKGEADGKMPRVHKNFEMIDKEKKGCVTMEQIKGTAIEHAQAAKDAKKQ
jgi:mannose/cellobiose epimerase-like protein (N-acyl-D-glucosamine 2-epimerase family)